MTESIIDIDFDDAGEFELLADNSEHQLLIKLAQVVENKGDNRKNNLVLTYEKPGEPNIDDISYQYMPLPAPALKEEDEKAYKKSVNRFRDFCICFQVAMPLEIKEGDNRSDVPELIGKLGWCLVDQSEDRNGQMRNGIRRYIVSKS